MHLYIDPKEQRKQIIIEKVVKTFFLPGIKTQLPESPLQEGLNENCTNGNQV